MINYLSPAEAIAHRGLRLVLLQGMPSPWGQAAKTIFEVKGLDYVVAPLVMAVTFVLDKAQATSSATRKS